MGIDVLAVTIIVASATAGFLYGSAHHERETHSQVEPPPAAPKPTERNGRDSSDDEDSVADGDLSTVSGRLVQPCKLVRLFLSFYAFTSNICRR